MNDGRNGYLARLAMGSNCTSCGATPDEDCKTPRGLATNPHSARIDRACAQYRAAMAAQEGTK